MSAPLTVRGELEQIAAAIGRVARATNEAARLEFVEHCDEVAGVDVKLLAQSLLGHRAARRKPVEDREFAAREPGALELEAHAGAGRASETPEELARSGPGVARCCGAGRIRHP